ncbi:helicase, type I site-specific restriction-modification system restriction subunit [Aciduliprofundum sp. MAR08-339]|uniref:EcoAI/FtnUII family type I restriction enzme subunit R n=1 Tax=Aciduliprofundum sp. (strain MAR08-339) TaxID=673860 RepID=UPI0002A48B75|nr:helicase, type I site-specific restriction-modification system restriction subunit [Aciduliprofundum sp. MAR08-339]
MLNEADTRSKLINPQLYKAGWDESKIGRELRITEGRIIDDYGNRKDALIPDYILFLEPNFPIAVVEAKDESHHHAAGIQQAKRYAKMLHVPFAYSTNGHKIEEYDFISKKQTTLPEFPSPEELWKRYSKWKFGEVIPLKKEENPLTHPFKVSFGKKPRYYQIAAVKNVIEAFLNGKKRILLTMATGTGKTEVAFWVVWKLYHTKKIRRVLYIADRTMLRDQAYNRFEPFGKKRDLIIEGKTPNIRDIYFATYQTLYSEKDGNRLYRNYPPDFFDMVIIDECHRSGYGRWREILDYFSGAVHFGMTATPKRDDNIDTYAYFGEPVYIYSLGQGIEDGFLAPYKIHKIYMNIDKKGGIILGEVASEGAIINVPENIKPKEFYTVGEFEKKIILPDRTGAMTKKLAEILRTYGPIDKTIVFCVTKEHALDVVKILQNELAPDVATTGINVDDYVVRIVDEEPNVKELVDKMADSESPTPVIAVTVDLLSTGIDVPPVKNIVFMKPIASKVLFKQIMGRGSRISEDADKFYFRIIDFVDATRLLDPWDMPPEVPPPELPEGPYDYYIRGKVVDEEDGAPVPYARITVQIGVNSIVPGRTDEMGEFRISKLPRVPVRVKVEAKNYKPRTVTVDTMPSADRVGIVIELKKKKPTEGKIVVEGINVHIEEEIYIEISPSQKLSKAKYIEYAKENVKKKVLTLDDLRKIWVNREKRERFLKELQDKSINPELIAQLMNRPDADAFDILAHIAFDAPIMSRDDRAQILLVEKQEIINSFNEVAKEVLLNLIEKYKLGGIDEISPRALDTPDIKRIGKLQEIINAFGGIDKLQETLQELSEGLYDIGGIN